MSWSDFENEQCTKRQRMVLYRLGLSRPFVHKHVKTREQASYWIDNLLKLHAKTRGENENETEVGYTGIPVGSV